MADSIDAQPDLFAPGGQSAFSQLFHLSDLPPELAEGESPRTINLEEPTHTHDPALFLTSLDEVFSPMNMDEESQLAPSPRVRLLVLQKGVITQRVYKKSLELKKKPRVNVRISLDLTTVPVLAELLGIDFQKPSRSTVMSLDELADAADSRLKESRRAN